MKIKIQNIYLVHVYNLMHGLKLKGQQSRARSKFMKLLERKMKEYQEEMDEIVKRYAKLDDDENPIINDGKYTILDIKGYQKELTEVQEEYAAIDYSEFTSQVSIVESIMNGLEDELEGDTAEAYDHLLDAFENKEK